jgi:tripartite-type tricarboxylate transporter receptor subunit TctC
MTIVHRRAVLAMLAASCAGLAQAQAFPSKPITIIVPFAPGGTSDQTARLAAVKLAESTGQQVVVENKPGANGATAVAALKQLPADGHTVLWVSMGMMAINPWLYSKLAYDPLKDLVPITGSFASTHFLLVPTSSPAKTVADVVALAKAKPGELSVASVGIGSGSHLVGEIFKMHTGVQINHVPYKGATSALPDVVGGRIDLFFDGPTSAPLVREGKLRALAVTDSKRSAVLPQVPTMAEAGFAGVELNSAFGLVALAGTPRPVLDRLNAEFVKAFRHPDVAGKIADTGGAVTAGPAAEFAALIAVEHERMNKVVKASGAKAE